MPCITPFFSIRNERKRYIFLNKPVTIRRNGILIKFPCIGLYHKVTLESVAFPCFERWYFHLNKTEELATTTMRKRAVAISSFLNFILWETTCSYIHEITLGDIRQFLISYKDIGENKKRGQQGWYEGVSYVYDFLANYYIFNNEELTFSYTKEDLITGYRIKETKTGKRYVVQEYNYMSVNAPKQVKKKNRILLYGYLDFILLECEMYSPDIALAVALQAYAGLREGEVVNLTFDRIKLIYGGFGRIDEINLDINTSASFANEPRKSEFGNIKKPRDQKVYPDFNNAILRLYDTHIARMESQGFPVLGDNPVFVNKWGRPMSVQTYKDRVKSLFYSHFLPDLKKVSEINGTWAIDAPCIEAYEKDYPGAHAFRHWFTMYLIQKTDLPLEMVSKWRGDSNEESVNDYIHINADMLSAFRSASHQFQRSLLEEVLWN